MIHFKLLGYKRYNFKFTGTNYFVHTDLGSKPEISGSAINSDLSEFKFTTVASLMFKEEILN
jgi:hypothetical protein